MPICVQYVYYITINVYAIRRDEKTGIVTFFQFNIAGVELDEELGWKGKAERSHKYKVEILHREYNLKSLFFMTELVHFLSFVTSYTRGMVQENYNKIEEPVSTHDSFLRVSTHYTQVMSGKNQLVNHFSAFVRSVRCHTHILYVHTYKMQVSALVVAVFMKLECVRNPSLT